MSVGVVVDSASNIPAAIAERYGIGVVPMYLKFGDRVYRDGVDLPPAGFYDMLASQSVAVSTSGPSSGDFRDAFRAALDRFQDGVVCVTVAGVVSVTHSSAALAAADFDGRVRVVDSRSASMAEGFVAVEAARASTKSSTALARSRIAPRSWRPSTRSNTCGGADA